ncbi:auxin response factor 4-like [Tripterygium wilfordii]|uniref:auxin response factor 4-like n=1 Tax=Tripterygium wilfordii TaxID=458696 RepID=UPI0018F86223|nr:auxin response factor 4-like [Tripterygium wilfordii]
MEIDLNHAVTEVEKNALCNGDCEKGSGSCVCCCLSSSSSSCSTHSSPSSVSSSLYLELWHACAGPLTSLPKKGNVVVYFPQGHLEQLASSSPFSRVELPTFDLPPHIFCRVVNVHLLANKENDEVYTGLTLLPLPELIGQNLEGKELKDFGLDEEAGEELPSKQTSHMFCKTLTASDTSTHGGFSVPRRAAEDCFPPLDYKQQRPSQELVAKDLHGVAWKFRHIYRGQPRRHLLTTGWSIFVNQKNLSSGDAVLFLRGEDGELRLGIRRAVRPTNGLPDSLISKQNSYPGVFSQVANALSTKSNFQVFYSPRASHSEFIIPYQKYLGSIKSPVCIGARFKMRFEIDDSPERRFTGVVTGVSDSDPYRWRNSKWRCLLVGWDENIVSDRQERVSPWEIEPSISLPPLGFQSSPRLKKLRTMSSTSTENLITGGGGVLDFEESVRSSKVLQGQENLCLVSPIHGCDTGNKPLDFEMRSAANQNPASTATDKANIGEFMKVRFNTFPSFVESERFPKVLQGQEICPLRPLTGKANFSLSGWGNPDFGCNSFRMCQASKPSFFPLAPERLQNMYYPYSDVFKPSQDHKICSYANKFPKENVQLYPPSTEPGGTVDKVRKPNLLNEEPLENISASPAVETHLRKQKAENFNESRNGFSLFGFQLTAETPSTNSQSSGKRSCTKVHKQGNMVGRAIDLSKLNGYDDLRSELERLFCMEGLLQDPVKGWRVLYTDSENDIMVVGDDPWREFCDVVSKIHIYTQEEVEKMTIGMTGEDTQSCLEQAPAAMEASKSSSVG